MHDLKRIQIRLIFLAITFAFFSNCAIRDIEPEGGFPQLESQTATHPPLLPTSEYDFHNNPRI